jgi:hypothetical protein
MTCAFNQSEHPFGQRAHFSQVEHFEKPWFLVMYWKAFDKVVCMFII